MSLSRNKNFNALGAVAPFALLLGVVLAGCGGSSSSTSTQTLASTTASTATATGGSTSALKKTSGAQSASSAAKAKKAKSSTAGTPGPNAPVSSPARGPVVRRYSGSGNTSLGAVRVGAPEVLVWGVQRPPIQIFTAKGFMLVSSDASSGSIRLSRGTYTGVRVATHAAWSIELHARS